MELLKTISAALQPLPFKIVTLAIAVAGSSGLWGLRNELASIGVIVTPAVAWLVFFLVLFVGFSIYLTLYANRLRLETVPEARVSDLEVFPDGDWVRIRVAVTCGNTDVSDLQCSILSINGLDPIQQFDGIDFPLSLYTKSRIKSLEGGSSSTGTRFKVDVGVPKWIEVFRIPTYRIDSEMVIRHEQGCKDLIFCSMKMRLLLSGQREALQYGLNVSEEDSVIELTDASGVVLVTHTIPPSKAQAN